MYLEIEQVLEWRCPGQENAMTSADNSLQEFRDDKMQGKNNLLLLLCLSSLVITGHGNP